MAQAEEQPWVGTAEGRPTLADRARVHDEERRKRSSRRKLLWIGTPLLVLMVGGVVGGASALHGLAIMNEARALKAELLDIVSTGTAAGLDVDQATVAALDGRLRSARQRLTSLRAEVKGDLAIRVLRRLPMTSEQVIAGDRVFIAAEHLLEVGKDALVIGTQYATIRERQAADPRGRSTLAALVALMATSQDAVTRIDTNLKRARATLNKVPAGLFGPIEEARALMVAKVQEYMPLTEAYAARDDLLPNILGWDSPKRYLVLATNPAELRPGGGLVSAYGIITFDAGRLASREFTDIALLDLPIDYPYVEPPLGLQGHLLGTDQSWQLADALWSPDFPTAAQDALALYVNESGDDRIDGVIALTTHAIDSLLVATGPVSVPLFDVTVKSGETTLVALQNTRESPVPGVNRKAFLDAFAVELLDALFALPPRSWNTVLDQMQIVAQRREAMAWMVAEDAQSLITDLGADGTVGHDPGDYVYVVDANVAPVSKLNAVTRRRTELSISLDAMGLVTHDARITWQNRIQLPEFKPYRDLPGIGELHVLGNYVRLLVPSESTLLSVSGGSFARITGPEEISETAGRIAFGNYVAVPPGSTSIVYRWATRETTFVEGGDHVYTLTVQKQPGLASEEVALSVVVPDGARITGVSDGVELSGGAATFAGVIVEDLRITVRYRFEAPLLSPFPSASPSQAAGLSMQAQ